MRINHEDTKSTVRSNQTLFHIPLHPHNPHARFSTTSFFLFDIHLKTRPRLMNRI